MHPWGKWGRNFVEYGVAAAQAALADAGRRVDATSSSWRAARRSATATRATWPAPRSRRRSAGTARRSTSSYGACASGSQAIATARAQILAGICDVALVVGADTTPKGFFAPAGSGDRTQGSGLAALPPARRHEPDLLRPLRAPAHGSLRRHRARLRAGEGEEQPLRRAPTRTRATARPTRSTRCSPRRWSPTRCGCSRSAPPATAARRSCCRAWSTRASARRSRSRSRPSRRSRRAIPQTVIEMPNFATDSAATLPGARRVVQGLDHEGRVRAGGPRPRGRERGRGLRPVVGARARLVREHRALQAGRGGEAAARRRHVRSAGRSR